MNEIHNAERTFVNACILTVRVRTTGFCGGDSGHGARASVTLTNEASFDFQGSDHNTDQIVIRCGGDVELELLAKGLRFAGEALEALNRR